MKISRIVFGLIVCLSLQGIATTTRASEQDDLILQRLNALEKENAQLRHRLDRLEHSRVTSRSAATQASSAQNPPQTPPQNPAVTVGQNLNPTLNTAGNAPQLMQVAAPVNPNPRPLNPHNFEFSGSLLFLQPGAGNLTYGTVANPFPIISPHWSDQTITPDYEPAFNLGARYMWDESNDVAVDWTHLDTSSSSSISVNPSTQMVGPPVFLGPPSNSYSLGQGSATFNYDAVNVEAGHNFCPDCAFQFKLGGGVEFARINENVTGTFTSPTGSNSFSDTTNSQFTGAGPRLSMSGEYDWGDVRFLGKFGGGLLIGSDKNSLNTTTTCTTGCTGGVTVVGNNQSWSSPDVTQVVPSIDGRLATAYTFPPTNYGQLTIEAGYEAAVYFGVANQYSYTNVVPQTVAPPTGIYLATGQHTQSNFTVQGPYVKVKWDF